MSQSGRYLSGGPTPPGSAIETITGNTGGAVGPTAGNVNLLTANTTVQFAGNPGTSTITQDFGLSNLILGESPPITSGDQNVGVGSGALASLSSGIQNTCVGFNAGLVIDAGSGNVVVGISSLSSLTSGDSNVAIGPGALSRLTSGSANVAIGTNAGQSYFGSESNNVCVQSSGVLADNNVLRIGEQGGGIGQQNTCYIAGIIGVSPSNAEVVFIDSVTGQLGVDSSGIIPDSFVTDSGTAVPSLGVLNVLGDGTTIATSGSGNTITISGLNTIVDTGITVGAVTDDLVTIALGATPSSFTFEARVAGFESTGPSGTGYSLFACARTDGATATLVGTVDQIINQDVALTASNATFVVSGNDAILRVTGVAGLTIHWSAVVNEIGAS